MSPRILFIIMAIFSVVAVTRIVNRQIEFIGNNAEILTASREINDMVRMVYIDYVISGRGLNHLSQESFTNYLRRRIENSDILRDPAKDPWLMLYHITVKNSDSYEIRSAGPDMELNTEDDIVVTGG